MRITPKRRRTAKTDLSPAQHQMSTLLVDQLVKSAYVSRSLTRNQISPKNAITIQQRLPSYNAFSRKLKLSAVVKRSARDKATTYRKNIQSQATVQPAAWCAAFPAIVRLVWSTSGSWMVPLEPPGPEGGPSGGAPASGGRIRENECDVGGWSRLRACVCV
ncbi:hypothetical protein F511_38616 [Dorcoceras hygrometricum]|uniref:Uncharacterized protein n=1 Tax=Dorcoceras hygrometricum TaxID=472368 RepID=A0A2Z7AGN8_9LAMI|nr:hypothetical protein F511_38616 [Dorcoceras hygrometricum]